MRRKRNHAKALVCFLTAIMLLSFPGPEVCAEPINQGGDYSGDEISNMAIGDLVFEGEDENTEFRIHGDLVNKSGMPLVLEIRKGKVIVEGDIIISSLGTLRVSNSTLEVSGDITIGGMTEITGSTVTANKIETEGPMINTPAIINIVDSVVTVCETINSISTEGDLPTTVAGVTVSGNSVVSASSIGKQGPNDSSLVDVTDFTQGIVFVGGVGKVYGVTAVPDGYTLEIPAGSSVTIPAGSSLTIPENTKLTNYGSITMDSGSTLTVYGDVDGTGSLINNGGTVNRRTQARPAAPELSGTAASDSITIQSAAGQMYAITETADIPEIPASVRAALWQEAGGDSLTFSGLKAETAYYIWTYIPGNDYYANSPVSAALSVSTLKAPESGETPDPDGGETPAPDGGETPDPDGGETPDPDGGETPDPDGGETPDPDGGETPDPDGGETPDPDGGETPDPAPDQGDTGEGNNQNNQNEGNTQTGTQTTTPGGEQRGTDDTAQNGAGSAAGQNTGRTAGTIQTGDSSQVTLWAGLLSVSAFLVILSAIAGRRRKL